MSQPEPSIPEGSRGSTPIFPASAYSSIRWIGQLTLLVAMMAVGAGLHYGATRWMEPSPETRAPASKAEEKSENQMTVSLAESKWEAAGIRIKPAAREIFTERTWRSGRIMLNEARIAHISPMIEGIVREVKVRLGQDVRAGDVLAVINSRELGQAKLELVKSRLATNYARAQYTWTQTTSRWASELVKAMTAGQSIAEIEKQFKDRPIGDLRQQLTTAYSRRLQAKAQYDAVNRSEVQGAVSPGTVVRLRADYEAAEATFSALCEEVNFQAGQQVRASEQKHSEAQTAEALSKATLMMLGFTREQVEAMDPVAEGAKVAHYPIVAPFSGTIIEQHAVLAERVGPQLQMFQIADLSTLWLQADIPQKDLSLVRQLAGKTVRFREHDDSHAILEASVFYTGDVIERTTRAVAMIASVPNPDRLLKPGMFVDVELTRPSETVTQIPAEAVQRQGTQAFVFIHEGGDKFRRVDVTLGRESNAIVEVTEGLKGGEPVVVAGGFVLKSELLKDQIAGD